MSRTCHGGENGRREVLEGKALKGILPTKIVLSQARNRGTDMSSIFTFTALRYTPP